MLFGNKPFGIALAFFRVCRGHGRSEQVDGMNGLRRMPCWEETAEVCESGRQPPDNKVFGAALVVQHQLVCRHKGQESGELRAAGEFSFIQS